MSLLNPIKSYKAFDVHNLHTFKSQKVRFYGKQDKKRIECKLEILFCWENKVYTERYLPLKNQVIWTTFPRDISIFRPEIGKLGLLEKPGFRVQSLTQTAWNFEIIFFLMFSIEKNLKNTDSQSSGRLPLKNGFLKTYLPWFKHFFTKTQKSQSFLVQWPGKGTKITALKFSTKW